jgi:hypothetical protein
MTRRLAFFAVIVSAMASTGCYWASPPTHPHGHADLEPRKLPDLIVEPPIGLRSPRLLLLGRFETIAPQPIGGLYDHDEHSITPLYRTYFSPDAPLEIFENVTDALRATGLDVRKDYALSGNPLLVEERLRRKNPLVIAGTISALQHDQIRTDEDKPRDYEAARLAIRITVRDLSGKTLYERELVVEGKTRWAPDADLLRVLGLRVGGLLTRDADFLRAVEAGS